MKEVRKKRRECTTSGYFRASDRTRNVIHREKEGKTYELGERRTGEEGGKFKGGGFWAALTAHQIIEGKLLKLFNRKGKGKPKQEGKRRKTVRGD